MVLKTEGGLVLFGAVEEGQQVGRPQDNQLALASILFFFFFGDGYLFLRDVPPSLHLPAQIQILSGSESDQVNLGIT